METNDKSRIVVTCSKGVAPFLKREVLALGFPALEEEVAAITTEGGLDDAMKLNLHLRTGLRVLYAVRSFHASSPDELYAGVSSIAWENYLHADGYFCVNASVSSEAVRDSRFAALRCKDAIADRFRQKTGHRPDSGSDATAAVVSLYWRGSQCVVYLDTSSEPLARRGYRKIPMRAPMQETLAAAALLAAGWEGDGHFINPMCGSGTLAIEAALIALKRAPGLLRENFGFMHLKPFRKDRWIALRREAQVRALSSIPGKILASDINPEAVAGARKNAQAAGVDHAIEFSVCDFRETPVPSGGGMVFLNPEYGERMGDAGQLAPVYGDIGAFLKLQCAGYTGCVFTGSLDLAKNLILKPTRRIPFFSGKIECRLLVFEIYTGLRHHKD